MAAESKALEVEWSPYSFQSAVVSAPTGLRHKVSVAPSGSVIAPCSCSEATANRRAVVVQTPLTAWIASPTKTPSFHAGDPSRTAQTTGKESSHDTSMPKSPETFLNLTLTSIWGCLQSATCKLQSSSSVIGRFLTIGSNSSRSLFTQFVPLMETMKSPSRIPRCSACPPGLTAHTKGNGFSHWTCKSRHFTLLSRQNRRLNINLPLACVESACVLAVEVKSSFAIL